jgi:hypothetical protein
MNKSYVICTPPYDVNSGGRIVLHYLCHLLNQIGETAYVYYSHGQWKRRPKKWKKSLRYNNFNNKLFHGNFTNEVVVYSCKVPGNMYDANYSVRYLLSKPRQGHHGDNYGKNDLIVGYREAFTTKEFPITDENCISIEYTMDDVYYQTNFGERTKTCYMIRKANKRYWPQKQLDGHAKDSICIDQKSHQEIAKIFNECDKFICYDTDTYFSEFAVRCGCTSIVIPNEGVSKKEWRPNVKQTYGIAYGLNDIEYAEQTKYKFLEYQKEIEQNNIDAVKKFVKLCENHFIY